MSGLRSLARFLRPDPDDGGCDETFAAMDAYAELLLAGEDPRRRFPRVAVHLRFCEGCSEDLTGLLAAAG